MIRRTAFAVLGSAALVAAFFMATPAVAQVVCVERSDAAAQLKRKFGEVPVSMGLGKNGSVIEVFASPSGSWTIVQTFPNGYSCAIAGGTGWEPRPEEKGDKT